MGFLFLGGHPAADFLNTRPAPRGEPLELIGNGAAYAAWLEAAGLLDDRTASQVRRRFGAAELDVAAEEARLTREWARGWIGRWRDAPRGDYRAEMRRLNGLLARAASHRELVAAKDGMQAVERWRPESARELVALPAVQLASLLTEVEPALLKQCAGDGCSLWFVDRTKAHRRLFCSASACGNRMKVAAFRERQRKTAFP
jgi:predicted RNA-binding Zn ribbon-like protein